MSSFMKCSSIGEQGVKAFCDYLDSLDPPRRWFPLNFPQDVQKSLGDILVASDHLSLVEVKTEQRFTGNLFLETFSNVEYGPHSPGWMYTFRGTHLVYIFLDTMQGYVFDFGKLYQWAHVTPNAKRQSGRMHDFPFKEQGAHSQRNRTAGHCVPIQVLQSELQVRTIFLRPKQHTLKVISG